MSFIGLKKYHIMKLVLAVFCWAIFSRVPTSILTRDAHFLWTNLGHILIGHRSYICKILQSVTVVKI
jgi:hypothetical protein